MYQLAGSSCHKYESSWSPFACCFLCLLECHFLFWCGVAMCVSKLLKQGGMHLVQGLKISLAMLKSKNSSMCSGVIKNLITSLQQAIQFLVKNRWWQIVLFKQLPSALVDDLGCELCELLLPGIPKAHFSNFFTFTCWFLHLRHINCICGLS